jgi:hypothetical protein
VTVRVLLPFQCDPHGLKMGNATMSEDGMSVTVEVPEGTVVTLKQMYGSPSSFEGTPDPYVALDFTLAGGASATLYWNGDGSFDGWDWGSNLPADEPERRPKKATYELDAPASSTYVESSLARAVENGEAWSVYPEEAKALLAELARLREELVAGGKERGAVLDYLAYRVEMSHYSDAVAEFTNAAEEIREGVHHTLDYEELLP